MAHARQLLGPAPAQLEQLASHAWHALEVVSKNCALLHVGRHRPLVRTGRPAGQLAHCENAGPLHVAQSGWQARHVPEAENVLDGQVETHFPLEETWPLGQVRQVVAEPEHVLQLESHVVHVTLSLGERKVPVGQASMHRPPDRTVPFRQPVHLS